MLRLTPLPTLGKVWTPIPKLVWKWCIAQYPWSCVWWPPSGTWAKRKTYPPLTASSPLQQLIVGKGKKEREKIAPKHCGRSHMALSGAVRHSTKAGRRKKEKAISHSLPLYTLHPHPSSEKLWCSQARRHLSEWQSEWGSKKTSLGTNELFRALAKEHLGIWVHLPCHVFGSVQERQSIFITPHLSWHHSHLLRYSSPFFPSIPPVHFLPFVFFLLSWSLYLSLSFSLSTVAQPVMLKSFWELNIITPLFSHIGIQL